MHIIKRGGTDSLFTVSDLKNDANGKYLNASVVKVTLYKTDKTTQIVGETWPLVLTYVASSNGKYQATLEDDLTFTSIDAGKAKIEVDASADPDGAADLIRTYWEDYVVEDDAGNLLTSRSEMAKVAELDDAISVTTFVRMASNLVLNECAPVTGDNKLTQQELGDVSTMLAAHFYKIRDMASASEKAGSVAQSFQYKLGLNLQVTMYGQQAMMLDRTGKLSSLSKGKSRRATVSWVGTEYT